jgi:hypothetical protein
MGIKELFRRSNPLNEGGKSLVSKNTVKQDSVWDTENPDRVALYKDYKTAYDNIPMITSIIDVHADQIVQDFYFEGPNKENLTDWADEINLGHFFHRMVKGLLIYGNAYVEVVREGEKITELKLIDPIWMEVYRKQTGDVVGFGQVIENKKKILWGTTGDQTADLSYEKIYPLKNQIVHFKHNVISSEKYGMSLLRPLIASLKTKLGMEENLGIILRKYAAPLIVATVGNDSFPATESIVSDISSTLKDLQSESELTVSHLVQLSTLDFNNKGLDLQTPIQHIEQQIITGGQVPPVLLGRTGEKMDKSSSEVALRGFGRHVKSIQREVKIEFEDKIIKVQGLGDHEDKLIWEAADEREWQNVVDNIRGLVTDGILTPQKANDMLPPRYADELPDPMEVAAEMAAINGANQGPPGADGPRATQSKKSPKIKDNPNDPTKTTKNPDSKGRRIVKTDKQ